MKRIIINWYVPCLIIIIICTTLLNSCSVDKVQENDLQKISLKGNVKSIRVVSYVAIDNFGVIQRGLKKRENEYEYDSYTIFNNKGYQSEMYNYDTDSNLVNKFVSKYDNKWNKIEECRYNPDGSINFKLKSKYDENGNEMESYNYNSDGVLNYKTIIKYDENENKIESNEYNSEGILNCKMIYGDNGNKLEEIYYKNDGNLDHKWVSKYNDKGYEIATTKYNSEGNFVSENIYKYDEKGNKIEDKNQSPNEILDGFINTYKYDENKNVIEDSWSCKGYSGIKVFTFKYDKFGNWVNQSKFEIFDNVKTPKYIIVREIEYY